MKSRNKTFKRVNSLYRIFSNENVLLFEAFAVQIDCCFTASCPGMVECYKTNAFLGRATSTSAYCHLTRDL